MKLAAALVAIALSGLAVFALARRGDDEGSEVVPQSGDETVASGVFGPGGGEASDPAGAGEAAENEGASTEEDESSESLVDPLVAGIEKILEDLVTAEAKAEDRAVLEERLQKLLEESKMGTEVTRREASQYVVFNMVQQSEQARRAAGVERGTLTPMALQAIRAIAADFATDLYRRLPMEGNRGHEGSVVRPAVDVELPEGYERASWVTLGGFEYEEGMKLPDAVKKLDGKQVGLSGYLMTLEEVEDIREFLLLESIWSCCFGVPAQLNQVILVTMKGDRGIDYTTSPVLVLGDLGVGEEIEDGFVTSVYRITSDKVLEVE